jgi:CheY-like chemotaxis protein
MKQLSDYRMPLEVGCAEAFASGSFLRAQEPAACAGPGDVPVITAVYNKYDSVLEEAASKSSERPLRGHALVVDDNPANRTLFALLLEKRGLTVEVAADGAEGVEMALAHPYDLILMDMQMPRMNGYEATRRLRGAGLTLPIVAVTANAMKGDEEKCLDCGCSAYLPKPVDKRKLYRHLGDCLDPQPVKTEPSTGSAVEHERTDVSEGM